MLTAARNLQQTIERYWAGSFDLCDEALNAIDLAANKLAATLKAFDQSPDFTSVVQALDAAHYPANDPIRRQIGAFDFLNILDEHEAGYDRRA